MHNTKKVIEVTPKAEDLRTRLLEQYTHEKEHWEEQVIFFLLCYLYL